MFYFCLVDNLTLEVLAIAKENQYILSTQQEQTVFRIENDDISSPSIPISQVFDLDLLSHATITVFKPAFHRPSLAFLQREHLGNLGEQTLEYLYIKANVGDIEDGILFLKNYTVTTADSAKKYIEIFYREREVLLSTGVDKRLGQDKHELKKVIINIYNAAMTNEKCAITIFTSRIGLLLNFAQIFKIILKYFPRCESVPLDSTDESFKLYNLYQMHLKKGNMKIQQDETEIVTSIHDRQPKLVLQTESLPIMYTRLCNKITEFNTAPDKAKPFIILRNLIRKHQVLFRMLLEEQAISLRLSQKHAAKLDATTPCRASTPTPSEEYKTSIKLC